MKRVALATTMTMLALVGVYVLWQLSGVVLIVLLSLAISAAARPLVDRLDRLGLPRSLALLAVYATGIGLVIALLVQAGEPLVAQTQRYVDRFVAAYDHVQRTFPEGGALEKAIARQLPPAERLFAELADEQGILFLNAVLGATIELLAMLVELVFVLALSIYWSVDREHFERFWLLLLPVERRRRAREVWREVENEVGAYLSSELVQSLAAALLLVLGYWAIGQPYPTLLATVGAVLWFVPWFGAWFAVAAVLLISLPELLLGGSILLTTALAAIYTLAVLLLLELLVEPRLYDRSRYQPFLAALAVLALYDLLGIWGILLGPPLAVALQIVIGNLLEEEAETPQQAIDDTSLAERRQQLAELRQRLEHSERLPPELISLVDRLEELMEKAAEAMVPPPAAVGALPLAIASGAGNSNAAAAGGSACGDG